MVMKLLIPGLILVSISIVSLPAAAVLAFESEVDRILAGTDNMARRARIAPLFQLAEVLDKTSCENEAG